MGDDWAHLRQQKSRLDVKVARLLAQVVGHAHTWWYIRAILRARKMSREKSRYRLIGIRNFIGCTEQRKFFSFSFFLCEISNAIIHIRFLD